MTDAPTPELEQIVAKGVVIFYSSSKKRALNYIRESCFTGRYDDGAVRAKIREQENQILLGLSKDRGFNAPLHLRRFALAMQELSPAHH